MTAPLTFSPEVTEARRNGAPVVALESTIITHGMPYPQNIETAARVEAEVRAAGAVPATIVVMAGRLHIGLTGSELEGLGQATQVAKLSRADLAACLVIRTKSFRIDPITNDYHVFDRIAQGQMVFTPSLRIPNYGIGKS